MKINGQDAEFLRNSIETLLKRDPNVRESYKDSGHSHKRYRWDVLWASRTKENNDMFWNTLQGYKDTHIDTFLRSIMGDNY